MICGDMFCYPVPSREVWLSLALLVLAYVVFRLACRRST